MRRGSASLRTVCVVCGCVCVCLVGHLRMRLEEPEDGWLDQSDSFKGSHGLDAQNSSLLGHET